MQGASKKRASSGGRGGITLKSDSSSARAALELAAKAAVRGKNAIDALVSLNNVVFVRETCGVVEMILRLWPYSRIPQLFASFGGRKVFQHVLAKHVLSMLGGQGGNRGKGSGVAAIRPLFSGQHAPSAAPLSSMNDERVVKASKMVQRLLSSELRALRKKVISTTPSISALIIDMAKARLDSEIIHCSTLNSAVPKSVSARSKLDTSLALHFVVNFQPKGSRIKGASSSSKNLFHIDGGDTFSSARMVDAIPCPNHKLGQESPAVSSDGASSSGAGAGNSSSSGDSSKDDGEKIKIKFGWTTAHHRLTRDRRYGGHRKGTPPKTEDLVETTLVHMCGGKKGATASWNRDGSVSHSEWNIQLPQGRYRMCFVLGDPSFDQVANIVVDGISFGDMKVSKWVFSCSTDRVKLEATNHFYPLQRQRCQALGRSAGRRQRRGQD